MQFQINEFQNNSDVDEYTEDIQLSYILGSNEYMVLPNQFLLAYSGDVSGGMAKTIDNKGGYDVNSNKLYVDSVANLAEDVDGSETAIDVNDGDYFRVGDLIQLGTTTGTTATKIEIMRVTGIDTNTLTVERGLFGSITGNVSAQSTGHASGAAVHLPSFNTQEKYDK